MTTAFKSPVRDGMRETAVTIHPGASFDQTPMAMIVRCPDAPANSASIVLQRSAMAKQDVQKSDNPGDADKLSGDVGVFAINTFAASRSPS